MHYFKIQVSLGVATITYYLFSCCFCVFCVAVSLSLVSDALHIPINATLLHITSRHFIKG